ncbi:MAG: hypothetical protein HN742_18415 [Lentisphaerae bacterium]|nr:hypothetical protein [Lentisphaerota bacterium]MBT5606793.1 hypothetical protein [Lentisphaerota bacterium]MBT7061589.1 hypothetical protein [Lentisphaerota bacterium]MBT7843860.1 hypothetical protein [Lentisphaerota bacterium]
MSNTPAQDHPTPDRAAQLLDRVASLYSITLCEHADIRSRLANLGLEDACVLDAFNAGYSNGTLLNTIPARGTLRSELGALGILGRKGRKLVEEFTGHITFPVLDANGNTSGIMAERPDLDAADMLTVPAEGLHIWNRAAARRHTDLLLTGSVLDALALFVSGVENTVAAPRDSWLDSVSMLHGEGVGRVTALVTEADPDTPVPGPQISLPNCIRPVALLAQNGKQALCDAVAVALRDSGVESSAAKSMSGSDGLCLTLGPRAYRVLALKRGPNVLRATIRAEFAGRLHVDTLNLYRASVRKALCADLVRAFDQPPELIDSEIAKLIIACEQHEPEEQASVASVGPPPVSPEERERAEALGRSSDLLDRIRQDCEHCGLVGETDGKLLCYLAAVSRKLPEPLSVLILSSSGAGKSALQNVTLSLCPPEDVVKLTSLTGRALFYQDQGSLRHKVLALEEVAGAGEAAYAIRNLISAGELVISTTVRDRTTGRLTTTENRVEGPTAVFCTTTKPTVDPETRSRFFVLGIDESCEQTASILAWQRAREAVVASTGSTDVDDIRAVHRNFQRLLRPIRVVNPLAPLLTYGTSRLQARRDQPKYLGLIRAIAFLRQMSKPIKTWSVEGEEPFEYVEADLDDVRAANALMTATLGGGLDELSSPARDLLLTIERFVHERSRELDTPPIPRASVTFTRRDLREHCGWSNYRVHTYLGELAELQYVLAESSRSGVCHRYRLAHDGGGAEVDGLGLGLKSVEQLERELAELPDPHDYSGTVRPKNHSATS